MHTTPDSRATAPRDFTLPENPATRPELLALGAVFGLGAGLRIFRLSQWSLWYDEGASLFARHYVGFHTALFDDTVNTEPPVIGIFMFFWMKILGFFSNAPVTSPASDFAIRLLPCIFGILAMVVLYCAALRLAGNRFVAIATVFLYAISPFHIFYAQELRIYSFITLMGFVACWCMMRALDEDRPRYWFGLVLSLAIMMYSHFITMWFIFACGCFFLAVLPYYKHHFWKWTAWFAAMMVAIVPALHLAFRMNAHVLNIKYHWYDNPTIKTGFITFKNFFAGYSPAAWAYWPLFAIALALTLFGILVLARKRYPAAALLTILIFVPLWGNVALWAYRDFSFYEHRLFIVSGAFALIAVATGIQALPGLFTRLALLGVMTLLTIVPLRDYYQQHIHPIEGHRMGINAKVDFRSVADLLNHAVGEKEAAVYATHFMVYSFHHYVSAPHRFIGLPPNPGRVMVDMFGNGPLLYNHGILPRPMDLATEEFDALWFVESHGITFEYKPNTEQVRYWLDSNWIREEDYTFDGLTVTRYARQDMNH